MQKTSRRNILKSFMAGGVLAGTAPLGAQTKHPQEHVAGPHAAASVIFGQWQQAVTPMGTLPLDRHPATFAVSPPFVGHHVSPLNTTIAVNGSVAFLIGGFHQLGIYEGIEPSDINATLLIPPPAGTMLPPLVDDPENRVYRGPDPRSATTPLDRVEVFHFHRPGTYLAICLVLPHFVDGMYGWIRVNR
jgi:hypothetical protein